MVKGEVHKLTSGEDHSANEVEINWLPLTNIYIKLMIMTRNVKGQGYYQC